MSVAPSPSPGRLTNIQDGHTETEHLGDNNEYGNHNVLHNTVYLFSCFNGNKKHRRHCLWVTASVVFVAIVALVVPLSVLKALGKLSPNAGASSDVSTTPLPSSTSGTQTQSSTTSSAAAAISTPSNPDAVHLVNCGGPTNYSVVVYCADATKCNFLPSPSNAAAAGPDGQFYTWEQQDQSVTFSATYATFSWSIDSDAATAPTYSHQGSGSNQWEIFSCSKDDHHVMYSDNGGGECRSIYYCLPA